MPNVTLNGKPYSFPDGTSIPDACRHLGIEVPTLCHDDRLKPGGACRLCVVEVKGWNRHATACNTALIEGVDLSTHSPAIEDVRRTLLELLVQNYPVEAIEQWPEKEFHRWLKHYQVPLVGSNRAIPLTSELPGPTHDLGRDDPSVGAFLNQ